MADLVGDNIMPWPMKILASTIGVTFVGPKNLPEKSLPGFMHVRQKRVSDALTWLKANNPIYSEITISEERLSQILEDGIPIEILDIMCYSDNVDALEREQAGYVPEDREFAEEGGVPLATNATPVAHE